MSLLFNIAESPSAPPLHPAWLMEVCSVPYQLRHTWLPNLQRYTCCNTLTVIAAPPGLLFSLQASNGHVICDTSDDTNIPAQSPWTSCRTDFIYHQPSQPHLIKRTVLVFYQKPSQPQLVKCTMLSLYWQPCHNFNTISCTIPLALAASIICSANIVR